MAATLLDNQVASAAPGTAVTITFSSTPAAGDLLLAFASHSDNYPDTPSGWTKVTEAAATGVIQVYSKTAIGNESSVTFTAPTPGGFIVRVLRYSGLGALDAVGGVASSGSDQILFGNISTTAANTLIFAAGTLHATALPTNDMSWSNSFAPASADGKTSGTGRQSQLGVGVYSASTSGTYTTTATYVPNASTAIEGRMVAYAIASTPSPSTGTMSTVTSSTGWTTTGGTVQQVLSDSNDSTLITSPDNPTNSLIDGILSPLTPPSGNFTVRLRAQRLSASTGTIRARLYENATLRSTVTVNVPNALSAVDIIFPANELTGIASSSWAAGLRLTIEATAAV